MNTFEMMTREELQMFLNEMKQRSPAEMTREELALWNEAMAALDEMNAEE